jgi:hypothetical protein
MNRTEITTILQQNHTLFVDFIASLEEAALQKTIPGKWNAAEQLEHVYLCLRPIVLAFRLPKFIPKMLFGKANRESKSYEALVQAYQNKLQQGGKAPAVYVPKTPATLRATQKRIEQVKALVKTLIHQIDKYSESELDQMILPHPLLGKLTLREMGYFAAYHVAHHHKQAAEIVRVSS